MRRSCIFLAAILLFFCYQDVAASVTATSSDTPVSTALGAGGSPLTSTISFPVSGTITHATAEVAVNVSGSCGAGALTLTGPGGAVTIMESVNSDAGDIFATVDDGAFNNCGGDCLDGCGMAGTPEPCTPESGAMAIFDGQTSDETDWTLSLSTSVGSGCGPWTIYDWSLTLDGPVALIFENGFESGDLGAWSTSVGVLP